MVHGERQVENGSFQGLRQRVDANSLVVVGQDGDKIIEVGFLVVDLVDGNRVDDFLAYTFELDVGSPGRAPLWLPLVQWQWGVYMYRAEGRRAL